MKRLIKLFNTREIIVILIFIAIILISPIVLIIQLNENRSDTLENQGYIRYVACVIDVRNQAGSVTVPKSVLDKCWTSAEQEINTKLERYHNIIE